MEVRTGTHVLWQSSFLLPTFHIRIPLKQRWECGTIDRFLKNSGQASAILLYRMKFLTQVALLVIMLSTSIAFFTRGNMKGCFGGILRRPLSMAAKDTATSAIGANKVMVFSKSKCPFCKRAKEALGSLKIEYGVIELGDSKGCIDRTVRSCELLSR